MSKRFKGNLWIALAFSISIYLGEYIPSLAGFVILACIVYAIIFNKRQSKLNQNISKQETTQTNFVLDQNGNFNIISFAKNPMSILVKLVGKPRREIYKVRYVSIDKKGDYLFQCLDEFNKETSFYYYETASLITFENKGYHTFDDLILAMTNKKFFSRFDSLRKNYLNYIQNDAN